MLELYGDDLIQSMIAVEVQIIRTLLQVHGKEQAHQSQVMITVQVTDENMIDLMKRHLVAAQLHLHTFTAIDQKMTVLNAKVLGGRKSAMGRKSTAGTEYRKLE